MADTLTPHYSWVKPEPGGDVSIWGNRLNDDLDAIDATVFDVQQAGVPVGTMAMWPMPQATVPANWLPCLGQSITTASAPLLFAVLGYTFGGSGANFSLPNMTARFPLGTSAPTANFTTGGEETHALTIAEMPVHAHGVNDPSHAHGVSDPQHQHTINDPGHLHFVPDPGHAHGIPDPGHTHGASQDVHSHVVHIGGSFGFGIGGSFPSPLVNTGSMDITTSTAAPAVHINGSGTGQNATDFRGTGIGNTQISGTGQNITNFHATGIGIFGSFTGVSIQNAGSGATHNNMPPYITLLFIVRYK